MTFKYRFRLLLVAALLLGALPTALEAWKGPCAGYGYCRDCKCPGWSGAGRRCTIRTCGHDFTRHY